MVLTGTFPNIGSMRITRVCSYPYLRAIFGRHHPLTKSFGKNATRNRAAKSDKKAAMNLSQFVASTCRLLPLGAQFIFSEQLPF